MPLYRVHVCEDGSYPAYSDWTIYSDTFEHAWAMWIDAINSPPPEGKPYNNHIHALHNLPIEEVMSITVHQARSGFTGHYGTSIKLTQETGMVSTPFVCNGG